MTEAAIGVASGRSRDVKIIALISGAHFVSHIYMLLLPALFVLIRSDYHVSYAELGAVLAVFNIVSGLLQTPAGFLVDRVGARGLLIAGLVLGAGGIALAGLVPTYWALFFGYALAGLANTVYHPADYAILSRTVGTGRMGQAFSVHTFFGMLGSAVAPLSMLLLADRWGWHGALVAAAALGIVMAAVLVLQGQLLADGPHAAQRKRDAAPGQGWRLLVSGPILRNLAFFVMLSMAGTGLSSFFIVAIGALYGTPATLANSTLTVYLLMTAFGVLLGGVIADRTRRHDRIAAIGFGASGLAVALVAAFDLNSIGLVVAMGLAGVLAGVITPSRDMIVRSVTPPGSFGKVFGFLSTGFNIAGVATPLLFGWLMDQNQPRAIFLTVIAFTLLGLPLVSTRRNGVQQG